MHPGTQKGKKDSGPIGLFRALSNRILLLFTLQGLFNANTLAGIRLTACLLSDPLPALSPMGRHPYLLTPQLESSSILLMASFSCASLSHRCLCEPCALLHHPPRFIRYTKQTLSGDANSVCLISCQDLLGYICRSQRGLGLSVNDGTKQGCGKAA